MNQEKNTLKSLHFISLLVLIIIFITIKNIPAQQLDTTKTIIMFGNSITHHGNWEEVLNRKDIVNWGIPGYTTQQLSWTIKDVLRLYRPKICFIEGGINDFTLGINTERIYQNQMMVMDSLAHNKVFPVYQTTLYQLHNDKVNRAIDALNFLMQKYCNQRGYGFIDISSALSKEGDIIPEITIDGTHLKPDGYVLWGKEVQKYLNENKRYYLLNR
jgi:lysophospholipase L1-like esterase